DSVALVAPDFGTRCLCFSPPGPGATLRCRAGSSEEERRPSKPLVGGSSPPGRTVRVHPGGAAAPSADARVILVRVTLVQGLLDYGEIDADELADDFKEVHIEEQLARTFHKGTL